jgi:hypothetical protein
MLRSVEMLVAALLLVQPPPAPPPVPTPAIKFIDVNPNQPSPPPPKPVDPTVPATLTSEQMYIPIMSDVPFLLTASPAGLVTITKEAGPMKVRAKFSDGNGKHETRNITAKYFATVEAVNTGTVELVATPVGATDETQIVRKTINVTAGQAPQPPPGPKPPVDPVVPKASKLKVLIVEETADRPKLPSAQLNIMFSKAMRDYLDTVTPLGPDSKTHEWRIWDKDSDTSTETPFWQSAMKAANGTPWIVVADGATEKVLTSVKLPGTVVETQALLKTFIGGN